jgi:hypothetical protein
VSLYERLKALRIPDARIAALAIDPPARKTTAEVAADLPADATVAAANIAAWRAYRDEPDAFRRMRMRQAAHDAIENGRLIDTELPEEK